MDLATVDHLLKTTCPARKYLDFERPVEPELIEECIEIALQAPTGSNVQSWRWMVITDAEKKLEISNYYRTALAGYLNSLQVPEPRWPADDPRAGQETSVIESAHCLADHLHEVPVLVIPCVEGRAERAGTLAQASLYGSILPAAWSFMLALRARGLGSAWTTLHLVNEAEIAELLGIPGTVTQAALLPVAYFRGESFEPAERIPGRQLTSWNAWGAQR